MATMLDDIVTNDLLPFRARESGYAREWAAYKHALRRVEDLDPEGLGGPGITPLSDLDEAAVALVNAAWQAGATVGAAFADAQAVLTSASHHVCFPCNGRGRCMGEPRDCVRCGGRGLVNAEWSD